jgi:hypothetical protein
VEKNRNAITQRGWGPRALNYNALCRPEVLASKPDNKKKTDVDLLDSKVAPDDLNLTEGLAGTLVERIVIHKSKETELTGSNAVERMRKRKAAAEESIRSHNKRITAGLLAAAGKFCLSADVRDYVRAGAQEKEANEYSRQLQ